MSAVKTASLYSNVRSMKHFAVVLLLFSQSVISDSLWPHELQLTRLLYAWDSPDKNTGMGGLPFLTPGDLPDPGIEPALPASLLHRRWILYHWATENNPVKKKKMKHCIFFLFEYSCFTMLCYFLLYSEVNQLYVYIYPLPLGPPSHCILIGEI